MAQQIQLSEAELIVEGWSAEVRSLPAGWSGATVRRYLLDAEHALDRLAASSKLLLALESEITSTAAAAAEFLALRNDVSSAKKARDIIQCTERTEDELVVHQNSTTVLLGRDRGLCHVHWDCNALGNLRKGSRVIGTLVGLVVSISVAELTNGRVVWVISVVIACIFCGFYLFRISYAFMIFFITIMIGQLYSVLHIFSPGLLVLRLEETAIGAGAGFVVALVVVPLSTRDTIRAARNNLLV
ncbi:FUSC family protein [Alicyclobacillus sp. ALC3]|uniref:FUSC family protein n=1 Tax=Alicyclobacillus sp. ALC3 TaxID=2796143 RepID=UPI0023791BF5|nr:FUSC family protein [Alicyclobacillus sp. ALC3]WDL97154.1 FUSC family protein [Alicyclobacillus sp. ALC3]